jgi:hypothetical protein
VVSHGAKAGDNDAPILAHIDYLVNERSDAYHAERQHSDLINVCTTTLGRSGSTPEDMRIKAQGLNLTALPTRQCPATCRPQQGHSGAVGLAVTAED